MVLQALPTFCMQIMLLYKRIWKSLESYGPDKVRYFLWMVLNGCLKTNARRHRTGETRKTNAYKDNLFDRLAIRHLSKSVQEATGLSNNKRGYESLVEAATVAKHKFDPIQQQGVIIQALERAFPKLILSFIKDERDRDKRVILGVIEE
ncbi:unnamed protein product [Sphenostylis stenocarpa]|uniref:Uncharacterized protein n=1 Tax=Sphenostylis stenocarpa TaxID=92480 RepID=A0AA86V338_9FABA|nr:unnamed protein product [Sphenostylis stenocarpa]